MTTKYPETTTRVPGEGLMQFEVQPHTAAHVLWWFGAGGYEPGAYIRTLLELISRADPINTAVLRNAYPEYVHAFHLGQSKGGIGALNRVLNGEDDDCDA